MAIKPTRIASESEALDSSFPDYEVVEHSLLQFSDIDGGKLGNNKYFSIELHKSTNGKFRIYTQYGKVGTPGVTDVRGPADEQELRELFDSIVKEKTTRKKEQYRPVKFIKASVGSPKARAVTHKVDAAQAPKPTKPAKPDSSSANLAPEVVSFLESIFKDSSQTLTNFIDVKITKDGFETPLGVLSYGQIDDGRDILQKLGGAIKKKQSDEIRRLTSQFYTVIPHKLGYNLKDQVLGTDGDIQRESDILQLMKDSLEVGSAAYMDTTSSKYQELGVDIAMIHQNSDEYKRVKVFIDSTIGAHHEGFAKKCCVENVFKIIIPHERNRFDKCSVIDNEQELFHGSRNCNIVGILKRGLLIAPPEAPVSGYAFGKGNYFADKSSKSLQYSLKAFGNYTSKSNRCYLFLNRVRLGKQYELTWGQSDAAEKCRQNNCHSTFGKASSGGLRYNEYITYELNQSTLTHVVELSRPNDLVLY